MSGSGRETHSKVRKCSGDPPEGAELVGRPSRRSGTVQETLPKVQNWSGVPPGAPQLVGRPSRRSGSGR